MENDAITPRAVKLFPKETCSCSCTRTCFHITAGRLMVGLPPNIHGQPNITELQRKYSRRLKDPLDQNNLGKMILSRMIKDQTQIHCTCTCKFKCLTVHDNTI